MTITKATVKKRARRESDILKWAAERGIMDNSTAYAQYGKMEEEFMEVGEALENRDKDELRKELGDLYVTAVMVANLYGLTMAECIDAAYDKIKDRKGYLNSDGVFVKEE